MRETTDGLLKDYVGDKELQESEPKELPKVLEIDGWYGGKGEGDPVIATDEKGYSMTAGVTFELMHGSDVHMLIAPSTPASEAATLLRQAADWLDRKPNLFQDMLKDGDGPFL